MSRRIWDKMMVLSSLIYKAFASSRGFSKMYPNVLLVGDVFDWFSCSLVGDVFDWFSLEMLLFGLRSVKLCLGLGICGCALAFGGNRILHYTLLARYEILVEDEDSCGDFGFWNLCAVPFDTNSLLCDVIYGYDLRFPRISGLWYRFVLFKAHGLVFLIEKGIVKWHGYWLQENGIND
ncbi:hypothetical protein ZIOFF_024574 [Zingiber officinale]|uniref:Transmembrane protein n=1 Tax=Zingiber officinale TaxID=94328 RepID=A0A8J5GYG8_ZINOF|nr:hypothetical protein ZIOFF_024574 [Zingiber officinale]